MSTLTIDIKMGIEITSAKAVAGLRDVRFAPLPFPPIVRSFPRLPRLADMRCLLRLGRPAIPTVPTPSALSNKPWTTLMSPTDTGALAHAVGTELQLHRQTCGWSRPALAAWSDGHIAVRRLITWEKASRSMSLRQLGDAGRLYQLRPSELLARAERRIRWDPDLAVDLAALAATHDVALEPAARWARHQLHHGHPPLRGLTSDDLAALADRCRLSIARLTILLSTEAPAHR